MKKLFNKSVVNRLLPVLLSLLFTANKVTGSLPVKPEAYAGSKVERPATVSSGSPESADIDRKRALFTSVQNGAWSDPNTWGGVSTPGISDNVVINHTVTASGSTFNAASVTVESISVTTELKVSNGTLNISGDLTLTSSTANRNAQVRVTGLTLPGHLNVGGNFNITRSDGTAAGRCRFELQGTSTATITGNLSFTYDDETSTESSSDIYIQDNTVLQIDGALNINMQRGGTFSFQVLENASATLGSLQADLDGGISNHDGVISIKSSNNATVTINNDMTLNSNYSDDVMPTYGNDISVDVESDSQFTVNGNLSITNAGAAPISKVVSVDIFNSGILEVSGNLTAVNSSTLGGVGFPDVDFNLFQTSQMIVGGVFRIQQDDIAANILEITLNNSSQLLTQGNIEISAASASGGRITGLDDSNFEIGGAISYQNASDNSSISQTGNATIEYNGTAAQEINISEFVNLILNNTAPSNQLTLANAIDISSNVNFVSGKVTANEFVMSLLEGGTLSGTITDARHVDGQFRKFGTTDFTFPVGDADMYRPYTAKNITASGLETPEITVQYFAQSPSEICTCDEFQKELSIDVVSHKEVWSLRILNTASYQPEISWGINSDVGEEANDRLDLLVSVWDDDATNWRNGGQSAITDNGQFDGLLTGGTFNLTGDLNTYMTFGSTSFNNPLPVEMLYFRSEQQDDQAVLLTWATSSEDSNDYFVIQRTTSGIDDFKDIGFQKGTGNSTDLVEYSFRDIPSDDAFFGKPAVYYRLKQVDFNGTYDYSEVIRQELKTEYPAGRLFHVTPSPVDRDQAIYIRPHSSLLREDNMSISISDQHGKVRHQDSGHFQHLKEGLISTMRHLESGLYFLSVKTANHHERTKLLVR